MRKHFIWITLLIALCSVAAWASIGPQKGKARMNGNKISQKLEKDKNSATCSSPRPKNRGCSIPCKPCQVAVCENGKWVYEKIDWPAEQCRPRPGEPGGRVCTVGPTDPCPAECKSCVRQ
jgi:hypothetical protein